MAGTENIKKIRLIDVENVARDIVEDYCQDDLKSNAVIKSVLTVLVKRLKGE